MSNNKLYVGNLAYSVRDQDLQDSFGAYGMVQSAKVMMDRDTGRSKWVRMQKPNRPSTA